jgi:glycosyltransferase involved in cell wall biosynthesis
MEAHSLTFLARDPWIGVTSAGANPRAAAEHLRREAKGAVAHLLIQPSWYGRSQIARIAELARRMAARAPNLRITVATDTAEDDLLYRRAGMCSIWCNHNALLDERIFAPATRTTKTYDAVYVGRLVPFKRHELAARVPRMAVVSDPHKVEGGYAALCVAGYEDLRFVNFATGVGVTRLTPAQVSALLAEARCGLALSRSEGAMYASAEYLLCGLPVVTTASNGGRDVFFHSDYVETVDADPGAVAEGVARVNARDLDPWTIRNRTLELFMPHRSRLLSWMSGIVQQDLTLLAGENLWLPAFVNKLRTWWTP